MPIGERIFNIEESSRSLGHRLRNKGWKFCREMIVNSDREKAKRSEKTIYLILNYTSLDSNKCKLVSL
jgi:hypothetical protein